MMKYSEPAPSTPLNSSEEYQNSSVSAEEEQPSTPAQDSRISLTQLWEYAVRSKTLPENLDLDAFFAHISQRLRNPEWEVRQHALRVLVDFVPLIDKAVLDTKLQTVLNDIVTNLGHIGPAVRKGAVDALKSYINNSSKSDKILHDLVETGVENAHDNKINASITLGVIIAVPFLTTQKISNDVVKYTINVLLGKLGQVLHQESILRALLRIKGIIGVEKFAGILNTHKLRREFEMLCDLYNIPEPNVNDLIGDMYYASDNKQFWNDHNQNVVSSSFENSENEDGKECGQKSTEVGEDKVILETEIKLDSGSAVTMKIHEESRKDDGNEGTDSEEDTRGIRTFKVLNDDSEDDYELLRRTPRRVRFGGEIVKMRTPDSDSNHPSDDDPTIIITPTQAKPVIEIHYAGAPKASASKSQIPVPVSCKAKVTQSEPSSPKRNVKASKRYMFMSSPNLSRNQDAFGQRVSQKSRIPRLFEVEKRETRYERSIHIQVKERKVEDRSRKRNAQEKLPMIRKLAVSRKTEQPENAQEKLPDIRKSLSPTVPSRKADNTTSILHVKQENQEKSTQNIRKSLSPRLSVADEQKLVTSGQDKNNRNEQKPETKEQKVSAGAPAPEYVFQKQPQEKAQTKQVEMMHNLEAKEKHPKAKEQKTQLVPSASRRNSREYDQYSPIPIHNEIEVLHNLARSPERKQTVKNPDQEAEPEERHITTADGVLFGNESIPRVRSGRRIRTADVVNGNSKPTTNQFVFINNYNSFHVYQTPSANRIEQDFVDSPIPTRDTGECLTCSSSGSDAVVPDTRIENLGLIDARILKDVQCKDDIRTKQRGLEELLKVLHDPLVMKSVEERLSFLLHVLFSAQQQTFVQHIAEQNIAHVLGNMREQALINKMQQIALDLSKTGSPVGVRLALIVLKRMAPTYLVDHLLSESILGAKSSKVREGSLLILMSISRIFPSSDMDIPKCVTSVLQVLKDKKRKVRQAALETLAALTQLSSTSIVLDVVTRIIEGYPEREQILRVIRTRLSRKQLPAVDINGNVRYSTPCGESEVEWIARGSGSPQSGRSSRFQNQPENAFEENRIDSGSEGNSDGQKTNYWKMNTRNRDADNSAGRDLEGNESAYSGDSKEESPNKVNSTQIWAIDPTVFTTSEKLTSINGTLRPLFVIQTNDTQPVSTSNKSKSNQHGNRNMSNKETNTSYHYGRHQRGRSFSPPKRTMDTFAENQRFVQPSDNKRHPRLYKDERFHKSFSSDQLLTSNEKTRQSFSLSSGSSTSTSGSSLRSGAWNKDVRSGIPVPISSDARVRFRTRNVAPVKGPVASAHFYVSKTMSPNATPEKYSSPPRPLMARQPFSSGSESSGYFTPPAEPHLPEHNPAAEEVRQASGQPERFIKIDTPMQHEENFTIIDSNYCENIKHESATSTPKSEREFADNSYGSGDFADSRGSVEENFGLKDSVIENFSSSDYVKESYVKENYIQENYVQESYLQGNYGTENLKRDLSLTSLDDLDFVADLTFGEKRNLSKSEADIQISPELTRKAVSSAPLLNEASFTNYEKLDDTPASSTKTSLPGSVVDFQEIEVVQEVIKKSPTKTICKKTITRQMSRKRSCRLTKRDSGVFSENLRPFTKTKEAFCETLSQLDSGEWEMNMKGLEGMVRLIRHHQDMVEAHVHTVCVALGKHIKNLRSQVARAACLAASEMFKTCKRALEMDLEELAAPLLHRTADTNKFLRSDANSALDDMSTNLSTPRVIAVITSKGCGHQNAIVRCTAARLLCAIAHRLGPDKFFLLPKDTRDRILLSGATMLMEGSLEIRKHAKMLLGHLSSHSQFHRAIMDAVPSTVMRHIEKSLKSLT